MPDEHIIRKLLLPELQFVRSSFRSHTRTTRLHVEKLSEFEVCPRCAQPSSSTYDHRIVRVKDQPIRDTHIWLYIRKRRLWCANCQKPFTEPVAGIKKYARSTQRYHRAVLWACERFSDLKLVRDSYRCSGGFLYNALYSQLELARRKRLYPWPKVVGIDEHFFKHNRRLRTRDFVSIFVDYKGKRIMEVVEGRSAAELEVALAHIPGRENVHFAIIDMCDPFRNFVHTFFPNASLIADKFHVLRLLSPAINRRRKTITGDKRSLTVRRWLLRNGKDLLPMQRILLNRWLENFPELQEVYHFKEALHGFYRIRGQHRAEHALTAMTDRMALSKLPEIQTLRRTLIRWRKEILAYFGTGLTNGRTEGFNNKAKLVKRRAYGYRSFRNYRLRLLNACA